jgi:hypothetical protein
VGRVFVWGGRGSRCGERRLARLLSRPALTTNALSPLSTPTHTPAPTRGPAAATAAADAGLELTAENVETVLDEVRPYLMAGALVLSFFSFLFFGRKNADHDHPSILTHSSFA